MKFTLGWLKDHLETSVPVDVVAEKLTAIGLEVEEVEDRAAELASFKVAAVVSAEPHPDADRLKVCVVDTGKETAQVVCGAPNARAGMKGVFAPAGTVVPGTGMLLKKAKIRGVESNGMLLSEREMGLSEDHEGIIELPGDAPVGQSYGELLGLGDPVIDIAITPNRQDCLGVRGVARDLSAAGLGILKTGAVEPVVGAIDSPVDVALRFDETSTAACPIFVGRYIKGVKNRPSPEWLQRRLVSIGLRPISALVDITNYITFDRARPLHVYDADKLSGNIHVRFGRPGEKFLALDDREYEVDGEMTCICDDSGVLGLGGIIGGNATGCDENTSNVFLESALFDPIRTATTGRRLGIESDARYRFERGVDPEFVRPGAELATRMILEICGGRPSEIVIAGSVPDWRRQIELRPDRLRKLTGMDVDDAEATLILENLGFRVEPLDEVFSVEPPPWRSDVQGEADLVEEIARISGYDRLPSTPLPREAAVARPAVSLKQNRSRWAKRALAGRGLVEAVTWSFTSHRLAALFGGANNPALALANPISSELDVMRPSVLSNLILSAKKNMDRGFEEIRLFEVGPQYAGDGPDDQTSAASGLRAGRSGPRHWDMPQREVDVFDAKADALATLAAVGAPVDGVRTIADAPPWYHPGRSGRLELGPKIVLGYFGELHPSVLDAAAIKGPVAAFEVFLDRIPEPKRKDGRRRSGLAVSDLQPVTRDFAFVVNRNVAADEIVRAARSAEKALIDSVSVFDVFEGEALGEARKSVAIAVTLQPIEKTLTDKEIDAVAERIVETVTKATGGELRG